ncbi:MAG TPA: aromatic amino acid ammonia-lyase [bacterium]|nr:aromatic amino acid ammonia-lyase [bacterium]
MPVILSGENLTLERLKAVAVGRERVEIPPEALERVDRCRAMCEVKIKNREVMYGVTTGIGEFSETVLTPEQTRDFQRYLIYSHAAGIGEPMPEPWVRAAMTGRINVLVHGNSGCRREVPETMAAMLNAGVTPVVCTRGSVGASGDLSPMGQMALVAMGEGEAFYGGERLPGAEAMRRAGVPVIAYEARDGLASINGSNFINGLGSLLLLEMETWLKTQDVAAAMTLEVLNVNMSGYDERLHRVRGHGGSITVAKNVRRLTEGSPLLMRPGKKVQDAYSLRSTPQSAGPARTALAHAREVFLTELNGVGDNPVFFPEDDEVVAGANFQGTPMALALEYASMGVVTAAVLAERRINRLMNPALSAGLPGFLTHGGGMFSGLMLAQYTAGAMICECRVLSTPAAVGSIPAAADQEDFVSMGWTTALKTRQIMDLVPGVLGIEIMAACQARDFRDTEFAPATKAVYGLVREHVAHLDEDRPLYADNNEMAELVRSGAILAAAEGVIGPLD